VFVRFRELQVVLLIPPIRPISMEKDGHCSWVCGCGGLANCWNPVSSFRFNPESWKIERWMIHSVLVFSFVTTIAVIFTFCQ
jgi:hypothetical protein